MVLLRILCRHCSNWVPPGVVMDGCNCVTISFSLDARGKIFFFLSRLLWNYFLLRHCEWPETKKKKKFYFCCLCVFYFFVKSFSVPINLQYNVINYCIFMPVYYHNLFLYIRPIIFGCLPYTLYLSPLSPCSFRSFTSLLSGLRSLIDYVLLSGMPLVNIRVHSYSFNLRSPLAIPFFPYCKGYRQVLQLCTGQ